MVAFDVCCCGLVAMFGAVVVLVMCGDAGKNICCLYILGDDGAAYSSPGYCSFVVRKNELVERTVLVSPNKHAECHFSYVLCAL